MATPGEDASSAVKPGDRPKIQPKTTQNPKPENLSHEELREKVISSYLDMRKDYKTEMSNTIWSKGGEIKISESKISFLAGALQQKEKVTFLARADVNRKIDSLTISEVLECSPPMTFGKPLTIYMKTCISALAGKEIPVTLFTQENPQAEWVESKTLQMLDKTNEIEFDISDCRAMKIVAEQEKVQGLFRLICDFYIHSTTLLIVISFSKDQANHDAMEKTLHMFDFVNFAISPHDVTGDLGSRISHAMKCIVPKDSEIQSISDSSNFEVDIAYLLEGSHIVFYQLHPKLPDERNVIKIKYECEVKGELEKCLLLKIEQPFENTMTDYDAILWAHKQEERAIQNAQKWKMFYEEKIRNSKSILIKLTEEKTKMLLQAEESWSKSGCLNEAKKTFKNCANFHRLYYNIDLQKTSEKFLNAACKLYDRLLVWKPLKGSVKENTSGQFKAKGHENCRFCKHKRNNFLDDRDGKEVWYTVDVPSRDRMKDFFCETRNIIYLITCEKKDCNKRYVGKTIDNLKTRYPNKSGGVKSYPKHFNDSKACGWKKERFHILQIVDEASVFPYNQGFVEYVTEKAVRLERIESLWIKQITIKKHDLNVVQNSNCTPNDLQHMSELFQNFLP